MANDRDVGVENALGGLHRGEGNYLARGAHVVPEWLNDEPGGRHEPVELGLGRIPNDSNVGRDFRRETVRGRTREHKRHLSQDRRSSDQHIVVAVRVATREHIVAGLRVHSRRRYRLTNPRFVFGDGIGR